MFKHLALPILASLALASTAPAAFTGLSATSTFQPTMPSGASGPVWTVQLFANFDSTTDRLLSITGASLTPSAGNLFYQNALNNAGPHTEYNPAFAGFDPNITVDSYVTMNRIDTNSPGSPTTLEAGTSLTPSAYTGGWTTLATATQTTGLNSYLIAQLTIRQYTSNASILSNLSVVWRPDGGADTTTGVSNFVVAVPAPGALALLGLAGLVGSRRRHA